MPHRTLVEIQSDLSYRKAAIVETRSPRLFRRWEHSLLQELEHYFDYFVGKRTEEIGQVILMKNLYYRRLVNSKRCSFEEMLKSIPDSCRELLFDFEDKANYQATFANEIIYRQGLLDGLNFRNTTLNNHVQVDFVGESEKIPASDNNVFTL
ncbi:hypothetical protein [Paenibacillus jiagnxiensis]|uniref:hypothetical protein n=1 Tax=Paenibacillus jiagnxiensis TaxID=3228926 RepID=UPI0038D39955